MTHKKFSDALRQRVKRNDAEARAYWAGYYNGCIDEDRRWRNQDHCKEVWNIGYEDAIGDKELEN